VCFARKSCCGRGHARKSAAKEGFKAQVENAPTQQGAALFVKSETPQSWMYAG
jgi:hypothetical protein